MWRSNPEATTYADHQDTPPYLAPGEKEAQTKASSRAWLALRLATTPDTWAGLMLGLPVAPETLDPYELGRQRKAGIRL